MTCWGSLIYAQEQDSILPLINDSMSIIDGQITLPKIGVVIERLMGNAYKCCYTSRKFKNKYEKCRKKALVSESLPKIESYMETNVFFSDQKTQPAPFQISRIPSFRSLCATYSKTRKMAEVMISQKHLMNFHLTKLILTLEPWNSEEITELRIITTFMGQIYIHRILICKWRQMFAKPQGLS